MTNGQKKPKLQLATFGGGCFWCLEAVYQRLKGVVKVVSGYTGGKTQNPDYESICTGTTGHAEVVQIEFDPEVTPYGTLIDIFWRIHDPTQLNRQGNDIGTQYRSVIYYHNEQQKQSAESSLDAVKKSAYWNDPIVTELAPLPAFYPAEPYHQNYFNNNPTQGYCQFIVRPKIAKFTSDFRGLLKEN